MVAVRNPFGKLRICIDPKDLNRALQRPHYSIPTINEISLRLANAKIFSVLNAKEGFWQVKLEEQSNYLPTFWTLFGHFRWLRSLCFEHCTGSVPTMVTRSIERIAWSWSNRRWCQVYGSGGTTKQAVQEHGSNLIAVLKRVRQNGLKLNKLKIKLRRAEVAYHPVLRMLLSLCDASEVGLGVTLQRNGQLWPMHRGHWQQLNADMRRVRKNVGLTYMSMEERVSLSSPITSY